LDGEVKVSANKLIALIQAQELFYIYFDNARIGKCVILKYSTSNSLKAELLDPVILGDKTIPINKIRFELPNMRWFLGFTVRHDKGSYNSRLLLKTGKIEIIIDKRKSYDDLNEKLEKNGGFITSCTGEMLKTKGTFSFDEYLNIAEALSQFLNFINGRRISVLFGKGIVGSEIFWEDYIPRNVDVYKKVVSWIPQFDISGLNDLWKEFLNLFQKEKLSLITAIHWYVEANGNTGFVEGSIVMVQNALELLYNWIVVEQNKIIKGDDSKNINAANKIRLLLSLLKIDSDIPKSLTRLITIPDKSMDGPEIFSQIRNAIVHSQDDKRKKLSAFADGVKYEALQLGIWYLELSLLYLLKYTGKYYNRCTLTTDSTGLHSVPWVQ
jgi:hypothetical protein